MAHHTQPRKIAARISTGVLILALMLHPRMVLPETVGAADASQLQPGIIVSLERQAVRERDAVATEVWIANDSDYPLSSAVLDVSGPDFMEWRSGSCPGGQGFKRALSLGTIPPRTVVKQDLCLLTRSDIRVGQFNILFVLQYQWNTKETHRSFVSTEKQVNVNLLGSENVAGVPLALAGFIVPGLFFWVLIGFWKAPWGIGIALGDKLIYSVLVSTVFVFAGTRYEPLDMGSGISIGKLALLAGAGAMLGFVAGAGDYAVRTVRKRAREALVLHHGEASLTAFEKLLRLNAARRRPVAYVRLKTGVTFVGSLSSRDNESTWLAGWYQIDTKSAPTPVVARMKVRAEKNDLIGLLEVARGDQLPIELRDAVKKLDAEGVAATTGEALFQWKNEEVEQVMVEENKAESEPLSLS